MIAANRSRTGNCLPRGWKCIFGWRLSLNPVVVTTISVDDNDDASRKQLF